MHFRVIHLGFNKKTWAGIKASGHDCRLGTVQLNHPPGYSQSELPHRTLHPHWGSSGNWHSTFILLPPLHALLSSPQAKSTETAQGNGGGGGGLKDLPTRAESRMGVVGRGCIRSGEQNSSANVGISLTVGFEHRTNIEFTFIERMLIIYPLENRLENEQQKHLHGIFLKVYESKVSLFCGTKQRKTNQKNVKGSSRAFAGWQGQPKQCPVVVKMCLFLLSQESPSITCCLVKHFWIMRRCSRFLKNHGSHSATEWLNVFRQVIEKFCASVTFSISPTILDTSCYISIYLSN